MASPWETRARIAGETDQAAYGAAVAAYRKRHPDLSDDDTKVSKLIRGAYGRWIHGDDR